MPPISVLIKPSSGNCNMACEYCFYHDISNKRQYKSYGFMNEETLENVIKQSLIKAEGTASFAFQGGEPSLSGLEFFRKVIYFQKKHNKNGVQINNSFQTNGVLIEDNWCKFFKENSFLIGLSVDGNRKVHNRYRIDLNGTGTFDKVMDAARLMDKYGVEYNILTVVHNLVASNIENIYRFYKNRGWKYQQYIVCLEPYEEIYGERVYSLSPESYGRFLVQLFDLWYEDLQKGQQPYIRQFENYIAILLGIGAESCDQSGVCGIQHVIESDGSVYPCDFYALDAYNLGNINLDNMEEIQKRREEIKFIENSLLISEECKQCQYYYLCRGGCQRNRIQNKNGFYDNYYCKSYKIFFDKHYLKIKDISYRIMQSMRK